MDKYSVLMSVYYKENAVYLKKSIESILNQTLKPNEFVIVCDGKLTKELDDVLDFFQKENTNLVKIVRLEKNVGLGCALNAGMRECSYSIIARMDSDDISMLDRCEKQMQMIQQGYDIVSGTVQEFTKTPEDAYASRKLPELNADIYRFARRRNPFNHPCVMYRKEAVLLAGGYKDFPFFEDYYLWARMLLEKVNCYNIQEPILYMRAGNNMYRRRGGIKYLKTMTKFRFYLYKAGISSLGDFFVSIGGQAIVCVLPNFARKIFYEKCLRK